MIPTPTLSDAPRTLLAYFSHSYRPTEKEINLFFWELLSKHHLYFTVDSEENRDKPMDITYLEWMMQRSACFVAVIPRRDDAPPYNCSPYQIFENGLAIRARKPRLIFVEEGLNETIFGVQPGEVYSFRRRREWLEEDKYQFMEAAERLAQQAHAFIAPSSGLVKPVALVADTTNGPAYSLSTLDTLDRAVHESGYSFDILNPSRLKYDFLFLQAVERYSLLISEVRPPYISPDVFGLAHSRCVPTIRICHLGDGEDPTAARAAMRLRRLGLNGNGNGNGHHREQGNGHGHSFGDLPRVLSEYQIDEIMEPVIFWHEPDELVNKISRRLEKITVKRDDLLIETEARRYFLRIGRLPGKVFISNAKAQNDFVTKLKEGLVENAVEFFHYKDKDAIAIGSREWLSEIILEIRNSGIFVALIDSNYAQSQWCMTELQEAFELLREGKIEIYAYVLEPGAQLPPDLSRMQVDFVETLDDVSKVDRIVDHVVRYLETGKQVHLRARDHDQVVQLLANLPAFASRTGRKMLLQAAGLPDSLIEKVRVDAPTSDRAAADVVDDLAGWETELRPRTRALGLLLSRVMALTNAVDEQRFLANVIRGYGLMPDIRMEIGSPAPLNELGAAYFYERKELGTFEGIKQVVPTGLKLEHDELSANLYALSVKASAEQQSWQETLQVIGRDIFRSRVFGRLLGNYEKMMDSQGIRKEQIGFCFASDGAGLRVPFEWATIEGHSSPLCLDHPVRRFLVGYPEPRPTLRAMLESEDATPLRVLLVASNTGGIAEVEKEIEEIYAMFAQLFAEVGWPESNICKLNTRAATASRIEEELRSGHYHILHFAGHGGFADDKPFLQILRDPERHQVEYLSALRLKNWLVDSDLRFVYLSTCRSAATEAPELSGKIQHFENMVQAIAEAHVPEVIGFVWPIEDTQSRVLAGQFYKRFLRRFDASMSLYHARTSFEEENRIWAAPVLIQQADTHK
jgi:CHAT domain/TIR domain/Effector-associated domain 8